MKKIVGTILLVCAGAVLVFAQTQAPPAAMKAQAPSVSSSIKQLELDWENAMKAGDVDKVSQVLADDWIGIGQEGKETKQSFLADIKSGASKIESFEMGPMDVKVIGSVAICQGSDTEKSTTKGKDSSGKWVWMDVFAKRGDKWVAVRSETTMMK
jgi:ketosteroid isomerase-like protein